MDTSTRVELGQMGDFEWNQPFSSGGWFMLRSAPNFTSSKVSGALISKMDATQHDRGWVLAADNGIISVELADQAPKEQPAPDKPKKDESGKEVKEVEAPKVVIPKDTTPMRAIKVSTVNAPADERSVGPPLLYLRRIGQGSRRQAVRERSAGCHKNNFRHPRSQQHAHSGAAATGAEISRRATSSRYALPGYPSLCAGTDRRRGEEAPVRRLRCGNYQQTSEPVESRSVACGKRVLFRQCG